MIDATAGSRLSRDVCRLLTPRAGAAIHKIPMLAAHATTNAVHTATDLGNGARAPAVFGTACRLEASPAFGTPPLSGTPSRAPLGEAAFEAK
jgi:hypothetical protein